MDKIKNYLPSKKFGKIILAIFCVIIVYFAVSTTIKYFKNKPKNVNNTISVIKDIKSGIDDTNFNGIANWEETLWGLDPTKNGPANKEFILAKRKVLAQNAETQNSSVDNLSASNKELTQEFFSVLMSLQQSGNLDEKSIQSISQTIGQKIEATPISDLYTKEMLIMRKDGETENIAYFTAFNKLLTKYENADIGGEMTLISQGLGTNDPQVMFAAKPIAASYKSFSKEFLKIPVPYAIAPIHLSLANNYEKTGETIDGLTQILSDPIVGMKSIINYKKYSDSLVSDLEKLSSISQ